MDITFKVETVLADLSEYQGTKKKLCIVSWNNRPPKLDLRSWRQGEDGKWLPGKGITLSDAEGEKVEKAIHDYLAENVASDGAIG